MHANKDPDHNGVSLKNQKSREAKLRYLNTALTEAADALDAASVLMHELSTMDPEHA